MKRRFFLLLVGACLAATGWPAKADGPIVPSEGFAASRYEVLWTKSPFAVATSEAASASFDYTLVGIAQIKGIAYASLTEKKNNEHFLLATDRPDRGLTLVSISRGQDGSGVSAVVRKEDQLITLKWEQSPMVTESPVLTLNTTPMGGTSPGHRLPLTFRSGGGQTSVVVPPPAP